jgi:hypothetical protein
MRLFAPTALILAVFVTSHALAENLDTDAKRYSKWTVYEWSGGVKVVGQPVYVAKFGFGHVPGITHPFTDNDGYWVAERIFKVPIGATNPTLNITGLSVDDRIVVEVNGVQVTAAGTTQSGEGEMQLHDPGKSLPYFFPYKAGPVSVIDTADLKPGRNNVRIIVNNTGDGIFGPIVPGGPTNAGIRATVTYTRP